MPAQPQLLEFRPEGLYCRPADVYIDPWRRVERAIVTHAHSDHARWGMGHYLAHHHSAPILRQRLGKNISLQTVEYGQVLERNGVKISLHPAGHIIGSAQVRVEYQGEIWVFSGDYKTEADKTCTPFEPVRCHTFITESTFGLPIYRWRPEAEVFADINRWWATNQELGKVSILTGYALGKAQRLLSGLDQSLGKVFTHGAVEAVNELFRADGHELPETILVTKDHKKADFKNNLVLCTPGSTGQPWIKKFLPGSVAMASGWMAVRGQRRRRNADRGFVLSDHADWDGLNAAVEATGAEQVFVTHGYSELFARWLREEKGLDAKVVRTEYGNEEEDSGSVSVSEQETEDFSVSKREKRVGGEGFSVSSSVSEQGTENLSDQGTEDFSWEDKR